MEGIYTKSPEPPSIKEKLGRSLLFVGQLVKLPATEQALYYFGINQKL
jgi:hypothetical protein